MTHEGETTRGVRIMRRAMLEPEPHRGGVPWKRINLVGGTVATLLGIFVTLHTVGWLPTTQARTHEVELRVDFVEQRMSCADCKKLCDHTPACIEMCKGMGYCLFKAPETE